MLRIPNSEQNRVIRETEHNILLFASAGTGKTFSVAQRVNHILKGGCANPEEILCLTFTTKASNEMRIDILEQAGDEGKKVFISTIHGFCYQVLKEEAKKSGAFYSEPEVIDEIDADLLLKDALHDCGFTDDDVMDSKGLLYQIISRLKKAREMEGPYTANEAYDFQTVFNIMDQRNPQETKDLLSFRHRSGNIQYHEALHAFLNRSAGEWAARYGALLKKDNYLDFEDLICHVHRGMRTPKFREEWQKRYKYIIVDEMQDTSEMEYDIIRCLFHGNNAMMCGDYFQTIYEWRGTNPNAIIAKFTEEFHPIRIVFTHNYRSTRVLCSASFAYLKNAFPEQIKDYYPDPLNIESEEEGERIRHILTADLYREAQLITEFLKKKNPEDPTKTCILSRTNKNISELYKALMKVKAQSPHGFKFFTVDEEKKFSNKAIIKNVLAFPRVILSERTDEVSLTRICRNMTNGIGDQTIKAIRESQTIGLSLTSFIQKDTFCEGDPYASLIQAAQSSRIVIYDTETTGLDLGKDQIVQIAAIKMDAGGNITDKMDTYVIPTIPITKGAFATHHISMDTVLAEGIEAKEALRRFSQFVDGTVLIGHNSIRFDLPLIRRQLSDYNLPELNILGHYDTMMMAKQFIPLSKNYKLGTLIAPYGIINESAHNAYGDIKATGELLYRMIQDFVLPTQDERRRMVLKYRDKFETTRQLFDEFEYRYMAAGDFTGLIDQIITLYQYESCKRESDREALSELKEYVSTMPRDENVAPMREFLTNLNLSGSQMDTLIQKMKKVPIITVHNAKGCEFDTVILSDVTDGTFPYYRSEKDGREPEERRLFYVAISRAKKNLIILSPLKGPNNRNEKISRYLPLIPDEYKDKIWWSNG